MARELKTGSALRVGRETIDELRALAEKNDGLLLPEAVVKAAKPPSSLLHSRFTWDDTEAAEKFRLWQARALISISVEYIDQGKTRMPMKVFVSLSTDRKTGGYRTFADVIADDDRRSQLIQDSLSAMNHFQEKYRQISELQEVFVAMEKSKKKLKRG